tara:strand:- start:543 stop:836 length:294 start_codon:yes stop_codon:yes gene_type:complete
MSHQISLAIPAESLRQLIESVLECTGTLPGWPIGRVSLSESEAAECIGVPRHVLRDARLRLKLTHSLMGRTVLYTSAHLQAAFEVLVVNSKTAGKST